jgi:hypothetical protein
MKDRTPPSQNLEPDFNGERAARRKLLWALGFMVSLTAITGAWSFRKAQSAREHRAMLATQHRPATPSQRAAQLLVSGNVELARKEILTALADAPNDAPALLVLACITLEENNLPEAREVIARLRAVAPERPEPTLLEKLLVSRQQDLSSGWERAFREAWKELGRPNLRQGSLLPDADTLSPEAPNEEEAAWRQASSPIRLTLALASLQLSEERARWLLEQVPTIEDSALLTAASELLGQNPLPAALRQEALPLLRQQLARLVERSPPSMQPRLLLLLAGTEAKSPLTPRELAALDELSLLPVWTATSSTRTFQQARDHLREAGLPTPGARAFLVTERATGAGSALLLLRRAEATRERLSEDERRWMGRMLWRIGSRLTETSSYLEHSVGLLLMDAGADDLRDYCGQGEASSRQDKLSASAVASDKAALERWPLPSLREEMEQARARDEVGWLLHWL